MLFSFLVTSTIVAHLNKSMYRVRLYKQEKHQASANSLVCLVCYYSNIFQSRMSKRRSELLQLYKSLHCYNTKKNCIELIYQHMIHEKIAFKHGRFLY